MNSLYKLQLKDEKDIQSLSKTERNEFDLLVAKRYQTIFDSLTLEEQDIVSIPAFFNIIELYYQGFKYRHLLPYPIPMKQDAKLFFELLSPIVLDQMKGMSQLKNFTSLLNIDECFFLLTCFEYQIRQTSLELSFVISSDNHTINFSYAREMNAFFSLNVSQMPEKYFDAYGLANFIFQSFTKNGYCAFNTAICYNPKDRELAEKILASALDENADAYNPAYKKGCYDSRGTGWLYIAAQHNDLERVKTLLAQGYAIDDKNTDGTTAFFMATHNNNLEVMKLLLNDPKQHPDINVDRTQDGATPLFMACQFEFHEAVELLLQHKVDANKPCKDGTVPLHIAVECENVKLVKRLLEYGANPNKLDIVNQSPLALAVLQGNVTLVQLLLAHGADANCVCTFDRETLPSSVKEGSFLESPSENKVETINLTPLELAKLLNQSSMIDIISEHVTNHVKQIFKSN